MIGRFGCYLTLFSFGLLIYGIENISHSAEDSALAARNNKRMVLTYEQFAKRHPKEGWFRITGGVLDLPSARAHVLTFGHGKPENSGAVTSLDIPLRSVKNFDAEPKPLSPVLVTTDDENLIKTWKGLDEVTKDFPEDGADSTDTHASRVADAAQNARLDKFALENIDKIFVQGDVEGIIKTDALTEKSDDASEADKAPTAMTADYLVLEKGKVGADYKARSTTKGVLALVAFAVFWGFRILMWLAKAGGRPRGGTDNAENPWSSAPQGNQKVGP